MADSRNIFWIGHLEAWDACHLDLVVPTPGLHPTYIGTAYGKLLGSEGRIQGGGGFDRTPLLVENTFFGHVKFLPAPPLGSRPTAL